MLSTVPVTIAVFIYEDSILLILFSFLQMLAYAFILFILFKWWIFNDGDLPNTLINNRKYMPYLSYTDAII